MIILIIENTSTSVLSVSEVAAECDIGKLLQLGRIALNSLSKVEIYSILTREPNSDPASYPHTRPYGTGAYRQFQPSWVVQFPWLHYSSSCDGAFCRASLQKGWVAAFQVSLLPNLSSFG